jgi:hypothetical protein
MEELLNDLLGIRNACGTYSTEIADRFGMTARDAPIEAFGMCFNHATLSLETMSFFKQEWDANPLLKTEPDAEARHRQRVERIIEQTKGLFVLSLSSLEFVSRKTCGVYPTVLEMAEGRYHYLLGFMGRSHSRGLIDATAYDRWTGVNVIRNTVIHNNAIAETNLDVDFCDGLTLSLREGHAIAGSFRNFARMTQWAVDGYAEWCRAFLKRAKC